MCSNQNEDGLFRQIPDELIRQIFSYFDIPSLGKMAQINRRGSLSLLAIMENTWKELVQRRFCINVEKSRSQAHGGRTWKDAFRSLSHCNRAPKCRHTPARKVIFAKAGGGKCCPPISTWVLLNHTNNCETRRSPVDSVVAPGRSRYIEFYVCIQNVKSSSGSLVVDVLGSTLELMGSGFCDIKGLPRIVHHRSSTSRPVGNNLHDGLVLHPFDYCVLSMSFECGVDVFETDVLARAIALRVPVLEHGECKAAFLPESDVWESYMQLPGGFLSLTEKCRLVNA